MVGKHTLSAICESKRKTAVEGSTGWSWSRKQQRYRQQRRRRAYPYDFCSFYDSIKLMNYMKCILLGMAEASPFVWYVVWPIVLSCWSFQLQCQFILAMLKQSSSNGRNGKVKQKLHWNGVHSTAQHSTAWHTRKWWAHCKSPCFILNNYAVIERMNAKGALCEARKSDE